MKHNQTANNVSHLHSLALHCFWLTNVTKWRDIFNGSTTEFCVSLLTENLEPLQSALSATLPKTTGSHIGAASTRQPHIKTQPNYKMLTIVTQAHVDPNTKRPFRLPALTPPKYSHQHISKGLFLAINATIKINLKKNKPYSSSALWKNKGCTKYMAVKCNRKKLWGREKAVKCAGERAQRVGECRKR